MTNLGVVAGVMADQIAVMYAGDIVEIQDLRGSVLHAQAPVYLGAAVSLPPQLGVRGGNLFHSWYAAKSVRRCKGETPLRRNRMR